MIKYVAHKDINKNKWDTCIQDSVNGIVYAYSWYLDIVCPKWDALIEDDYKSVLPLPKAEKYGFRYTYPPPFTQQLGVFSTSKLSNEKVEMFLEQIPARYKYIEMNLNTLNRVKADSFESRNLITHLLDLISPYEHTYANYSTQAKRNLKKAQASSLNILTSVPPQKVIDLFKANRGKKYKHPASYYSTLNKLVLTCMRKNSGQAWGVYTSEKELCAGALFVGSNKRIIFLFSGTNQKAFDTHAMTLLIDRFIKDNSQREVTLDFEGSLDMDVARFYKGFGSKEVHFQQIRRNNLPYPVKWIKDLQFKKKSAQS